MSASPNSSGAPSPGVITSTAAALQHPHPGAVISAQELATALPIHTTPTERLIFAHDASHYVIVPGATAVARSAGDIAALFATATRNRTPVTFRSGATSLSGQALGEGIVVDTRKHFRGITVGAGGRTVTVEPGATVQAVNAQLAAYGRMLGPDPASSTACTIGGVVANNSSGMSSGHLLTAYYTCRSMVFVLPSGTTINTADPDADAQLAAQEPALHKRLIELRDRLRANPVDVAEVRRQFSMKNTMGYSLNALLDYEQPVDILAHLLIGSEGTLGFIASATLETVPVRSQVATGLLVYPTVVAASEAVPSLVEQGYATVELLDATSLRVAQRSSQVAASLKSLEVDQHAALLVELQADTGEELDSLLAGADRELAAKLSRDPRERALLWQARKGLYTTVASNRPSGTNALLEDIVVPKEVLGETCHELTKLFHRYHYQDSVIFGHAKDGNVHFMLNEHFAHADKITRYREFTEDMVDLILGYGGSLKAEHGTGRIMAPFVRRQFGESLYQLMWDIKNAVDPAGILNPGVVLTLDDAAFYRDLKVAATVEEEVDRCVECGYCEPVCPAKDVTLTPRGRIALRRELTALEKDPSADEQLKQQLAAKFRYQAVDTCAVDGMCYTRCPVGINTGDLVRRLRAENPNPISEKVWDTAARHWGVTNMLAGQALGVAKLMPATLPKLATAALRTVAGSDNMPLYKAELPAGGAPRRGRAAANPDFVYFPACVNSMFAGVDAAGESGPGVTEAFEALCARAGLSYRIPARIGSYCCGTPWKSKGYHQGYQEMANRVLAGLWEASEHGRLPIVCDASSCTGGIFLMWQKNREAYPGLEILDHVQFATRTLLPRLEVLRRSDSLVVHPTCSITHLDALGELVQLAEAVAAEVTVPKNWGCCAYAGDRGLLHPELTASATRAEAREVTQRSYAAYASSNRTCEQGLTEATGQPYRNILQLLDEATRPE